MSQSCDFRFLKADSQPGHFHGMPHSGLGLRTGPRSQRLYGYRPCSRFVVKRLHVLRREVRVPQILMVGVRVDLYKFRTYNSRKIRDLATQNSRPNQAELDSVPGLNPPRPGV